MSLSARHLQTECQTRTTHRHAQVESDATNAQASVLDCSEQMLEGGKLPNFHWRMPPMPGAVKFRKETMWTQSQHDSLLGKAYMASSRSCKIKDGLRGVTSLLRHCPQGGRVPISLVLSTAKPSKLKTLSPPEPPSKPSTSELRAGARGRSTHVVVDPIGKVCALTPMGC